MLRFAACMAALLALSFAFPVFSGDLLLVNGAIKFVIFVVSVGAQFICYDDTFFHIVNKCMFGWLTLSCSLVWAWLIREVFDIEGFELVTDAVLFAVTSAVFFFFSYYNHRRRIKGKSSRGFAAQLVVIEGVCVVIFSFIDSVPELKTDWHILILVFAVIYLCFGLLNSFSDEKRLNDERAVLLQMREKEKNQYETSKEYIDIINLKAHDMKHLLYGLKQKMGNPSAEKELDRIEQVIDEYSAYFKTGNEALDIILTEKSRYCAKKNISFSAMADGELLSFIDPVDIYSLAGNILDNAIEAVEREDEGNRSISFFIRKESGVAHIRAENYCTAKISFSGGLPVTTKADKAFHGFGTKSINAIADKYHGYAHFNLADNTFITDILLPLPE